MMVASTPASSKPEHNTRRSSRRQCSRIGQAAESEDPATAELLSSQATEDTSHAPGVSTRRSKATRSGGNVSTGAVSPEPPTPAVPGTLRRSRRRQARQEAEMPLSPADDDKAGTSKHVPMPARRSGFAQGPPAAASAEQAAAQPDSAQPAAERPEASSPAGEVLASKPPRRRNARAKAAAPPAETSATAAAEATTAQQAGPAAMETSGVESDDDDAAGAAAAELGDDLLCQLAAGMAAALAARRQPAAAGAGPSGEPEASETDLSDSSSSRDGDSSSSSSEDERHDAGRAPPAASGLTRAEKAALHWVPQSQLPALDDDETLDKLEHAARSGLAAQAKQVVVPPQDARRLAREQRKSRPDTAGDGWFDLPATQITPQVKQDLRMLALRGALDPKRFYRNPDATKFPKYFQMGTVVGGPTDFYTGRLTKKERRQTLTEELLADQALQQAHKRRFAKLQAERSKFKDKRSIAKRKNSNLRLKAHRKKPKH